MSNVWMKRNPFMSLWLSAANRAVGAARGRAIAEERKQQLALIRSVTSAWTNPPTGQPSVKKGRKKS